MIFPPLAPPPPLLDPVVVVVVPAGLVPVVEDVDVAPKRKVSQESPFFRSFSRCGAKNLFTEKISLPYALAQVGGLR